MYCSSFKSCLFGKVVGKVNTDFRFNVNYNIIDEKRNMTIINREKRVRKRSNRNNEIEKWYKYKCNKCGWDEGWIEESNLISGSGCSCCDGKTVVPGINDIPTTTPWMVKYFINPEDAYKYSYGSSKKIYLKCPGCGYKKKLSLSDLKYKGFGCNKCSDGIKYPNKFFMELLNQLNIEFEVEYSPQWLGNKRFDFYIPSKRLIIEMDGALGHGYHDNKMNGISKKDSKEIDKIKDDLADANGIKVIRIDCDYKNQSNRFEYIKNSILNSELIKYIKLDDINWLECDSKGCKSLIREVCDYKNKHTHIKNTVISEKFNISISTVIRYLKIGNNNGWCKYNTKENKGNKIEVFKDGISYGVFNSALELSKNSISLFGIKLSDSSIGRACKSEIGQYKGYTFKYVKEVA